MQQVSIDKINAFRDWCFAEHRDSSPWKSWTSAAGSPARTSRTTVLSSRLKPGDTRGWHRVRRERGRGRSESLRLDGDPERVARHSRKRPDPGTRKVFLDHDVRYRPDAEGGRIGLPHRSGSRRRAPLARGLLVILQERHGRMNRIHGRPDHRGLRPVEMAILRERLRDLAGGQLRGIA